MARQKFRTTWNGWSRTRKIIFALSAAVAAAFGVFILIVSTLLVWWWLSSVRDEYRTQQWYAQTQQRCGQRPIVVVNDHALTSYRTVLYTPRNPEYDDYRTVASQSIFGDTTVLGYYCTVTDALAANWKAIDDDDAKNYQSASERVGYGIDAAEKLGYKFYAPSVVPAGVQLAGTFANSDGSDTFMYQIPGSGVTLDDINLLEVDCIPGLDDSSDPISEPAVRVGTHALGAEIMYARYADPTSVQTQFWKVNLPAAKCVLQDDHRLLSAEAGLKIMQSIQEINTATLKQYSARTTQ